MRILMMGTGGFAVPTFRWLLESAHHVLALVTRPPKTARGRASIHPMREVAEAYDLPVMMPNSVNETSSIEQLAEMNADLHVVCDYGQILSADALSTSRLGGINLHASLLPKYRGAAPINWALFHGEEETGISVIHMTPKLDAGPCLVQKRIPIDSRIDAVQLECELAELGVRGVQESVEMLKVWDGQSLLGHRQDPARVSRAPRLKKTDGQVDWSRSARQIFDQVRAFKPWPGTFTTWQRRKKPMRLVLDQVDVAEHPESSAAPGTVVAQESGRALISCGHGILELRTVQPEGKKCMPIEAFLRGYPLSVGDRLG